MLFQWPVFCHLPFICTARFFPQSLFLTRVPGGEVKDRELLYPGPGGQHASLAGGQVFFFSGKFFVLIAKHGFDIKMIGSFGQVDNLIGVGIIVHHIGDVGDLLAWCNQGNLCGQFPQLKFLNPRAGFVRQFKFGFGIRAFVPSPYGS